MLLPALLELFPSAASSSAAPGLFSALGLLSSDLVYSDSRSAYVRSRPTPRPDRGVFRAMEGGCAPASATATASDPAQLRRPPARPELGDAVRRGARRSDHAETVRGCRAPSTMCTNAATATASPPSPCRASPTGSSWSCPARRSTTRPLGAGGEAAAGAHDLAAPLRRHRSTQASTSAPRCRPASGSPVRPIVREGLSTTSSCPGRSPTVGPTRRAGHRAREE